MKVYTIEEVAKALKVHDRTVRRYIKVGGLKAVNLGSTGQPNWRIQEDDLMEFLESRKIGQKDDVE